MKAKPYLDRYVNPPEFLERAAQDQLERERNGSEARNFRRTRRSATCWASCMHHAPLDNWQRDVRQHRSARRAYYFLPQRQTKVMNEGWASYWHSKIMTTRVLTDAEVIDYADHHSGTVATQPGRLNPYKLGLELFRDIERRWDKGQFGSEWEDCQDMAARNSWDRKVGLGRHKIFEVRRVHSDATFLDEFLTPEFCAEQKLFVTKQDGKTKQPVIDSREFVKIKQALLFQFTNGGRPVIELVDANFANRGEMLLVHRHVGVDLRWDWAKEVLEDMVRLWRRPVRLESIRDGKPVRVGYDGDKVSEENLSDTTQAKSA